MKIEIIKHLQGVLDVETDGIIGPITKKALHDKLVAIARKEIGVSEIGTTNTGKRVKEYQASTSLGGTGWPWCAAFICWIFLESGIFTNENRPKTAGAFRFEEWGNQLGIPVIKKPKEIKRGDIVIYTFSHIGIATNDSIKGRFKAIEGNTDGGGSREGGAVMEKSRTISSVRSVIRI
jgi:hypothetical protein